MDVVVVESPTKARSINKYLGSGYRVLSSYGHVRDLPEKDGSVLPEEDFKIVYELLADKEKRVAEIAKALKGADRLYLATDPDREGEAISWHVYEVLKERKVIDSKPVQRVVFHEVTKRAIQEAIDQPRDLSEQLVNAQQARRALDYLVGFNLSPLLWKKVRRGLSAGRVQSPALRLIVEREDEITAFKAEASCGAVATGNFTPLSSIAPTLNDAADTGFSPVACVANHVRFRSTTAPPSSRTSPTVLRLVAKRRFPGVRAE